MLFWTLNTDVLSSHTPDSVLVCEGVWGLVRVLVRKHLKSGSCLQFLSPPPRLRLTCRASLWSFLEEKVERWRWRWGRRTNYSSYGSENPPPRPRPRPRPGPLTCFIQSSWRQEADISQLVLLNSLFISGTLWSLLTATPGRSLTSSSLRNGPNCTGSPQPTPSVLQVKLQLCEEKTVLRN